MIPSKSDIVVFGHTAIGLLINPLSVGAGTYNIQISDSSTITAYNTTACFKDTSITTTI